MPYPVAKGTVQMNVWMLLVCHIMYPCVLQLWISLARAGELQNDQSLNSGGHQISVSLFFQLKRKLFFVLWQDDDVDIPVQRPWHTENIWLVGTWDRVDLWIPKPLFLKKQILSFCLFRGISEMSNSVYGVEISTNLRWMLLVLSGPVSVLSVSVIQLVFCLQNERHLTQMPEQLDFLP